MTSCRRLICALLFAATSSSLHAATFTWSGGALLNSKWSNDNNWTTSAPPTNGTASLVFTGTDRTDANADSPWNILSLAFNTAAGGFAIQGELLAIGSGGVTNNDNTLQTIQNDIILSVSQTWSTAGIGGLNMSGAVNTNTRTLTVTPTLINNAIDLSGAITGTGGLSIGGAGHVNLIGTANSYTGTTTVNAATLLLNKSPGVTSIAGPLVIGNGIEGTNATVIIASPNQIANTSDVTITLGGIIDINESDTIDSLSVNGGITSISAAKSLTVNSLSLGGSVSGNSGTLILNGNLTTSASLDGSVISTSLDLNALTRTFNVVPDALPAVADLNVSGVISSGGITKTGSGTLKMSGNSNTYLGPTTVNAGILELSKNAGQTAITGPLTIGDGTGAGTVKLLVSEQIANTSSVTINGGLLDLNGLNETLGSLAMAGGTVSTGAGSITLAGNITAQVSAAAPASINGKLNLGGATRTFTVNNNINAPLDLDVAALISNGGIIKDGLGTLRLSSPTGNTFAGGVSVIAGELAVSSNTAAGSGTLSMSTGASIRADGAPRSLATGVALSGNVTIGGTFDLTFNGQTTLGSDSTMTVTNTGLTTFAAVGQDSSSRALIKLGTGTLVLSGINTYTGGTQVNQGKVISSGSLAASKGVSVDTGATFEVVHPQSIKGLHMFTGGLAVLSSTTPTFLTTNSLVLEGLAALDINQRALAINYDPGQSPLASIRSSIISGYAGGVWTGPGIRSATAAVNSNFAIGYAEASDILGPTGGLFLDQNVDGDTVLIRTTLSGDANLDGAVGFADLVAVAQHYGNNTGSATWNIGDFNYDGTVGFADLVAVAQHYGGNFPSGAAIPAASAEFDHDLAAAFAQVPEPATPALVVFAACGALFRRSRRR